MSGSYSFLGPVWTGHLVTWSFATTTFVEDGGKPFSDFIAGTYQAIVRSAANTWSHAAGVDLLEVPDGPGVDIRIGWGIFGSRAEGIAVGTTFFPHQTNTSVMQPDVIVQMEDPVLGGLISTGPGTFFYLRFGDISLYQIVLHELGHALGLGHSNLPTAVMYPFITGQNSVLAQADIDGMRALYGAPFAGLVRAIASGVAVDMMFDDAALAAVADGLLRQRSDTVFDASGAGVTYRAFAPGDTTVTNAAGIVTVVGSGRAGQAVIAGRGAINFYATGSGTVIAGGGGNVIGIPAGVGGDWDVRLGPGDDVIQALGGNDSINAGAGNNLVFLGAGASSVIATGQDTIIGGGGASTIHVAAGNTAAYAGTGRLTLLADAGIDTIIGNGGQVVVTGGPFGGLFTGGTQGANRITAGAGAATIVGAGQDDILYAGGSAGDLIAGGAGSGTISAEVSLGNDTLFAGAGDTLLRGGFGLDILVPGTGNDTIEPGPGAELIAFINGRSGGFDEVHGFVPGYTAVLLAGYGPSATADALAAATVNAGSTSIVLPDGTHVLFVGMASLTAANFL